MSDLTLFSTPKAFTGHIGMIQENAIQSWKNISDQVEIILLGDDVGVKEISHKYNLIHIPKIKKTKLGTPLIDSIFYAAQKKSTSNTLAYVNADIILFNDFLETIHLVRRKFCEYLVVGQRWDYDIKQKINFNRKDWEMKLKKSVLDLGLLHSMTGIDYFVFNKYFWKQIPKFAIGRTAWDHWFIYDALQRNSNVIDATLKIMAIHQNHSYSHVKGGKESVFKGNEAYRNRFLAGEYIDRGGCSIEKSNWKILSNKRISHQNSGLENRNYRTSYFYNLAVHHFSMKEYALCEHHFRQVIRYQKVEKYYLAEIYFYLGEISRIRKKTTWRRYYRQSINYFKVLKKKSELEIYRLALMYKHLNQLDLSMKYLKMIRNTSDKNLLNGMHFHRGEILLSQGDKKNAFDEFILCLRYNPANKIAKKYLNQILNTSCF